MTAYYNEIDPFFVMSKYAYYSENDPFKKHGGSKCSKRPSSPAPTAG
jgi:hypothetical protein